MFEAALLAGFFTAHAIWSVSEAVTVALPYTPASSTIKFRVHKPKIVSLSDHLQNDFQNIFNKFFEGIDLHEQGSKVWSDHLDESI